MALIAHWIRATGPVTKSTNGCNSVAVIPEGEEPANRFKGLEEVFCGIRDGLTVPMAQARQSLRVGVCADNASRSAWRPGLLFALVGESADKGPRMGMDP